MINKERLYNRLTELGQIGNTKDGLYCVALSDEENKAHDLVAMYMEEAGMTVRVDPAGNLIGRKEGSEPGLPVVMTGSHIDTIYGGGMFDGRLGVIGGIEAVQTMTEAGIQTRHPIEVLVYRDEEGTRFGTCYSSAEKLTQNFDPDIMKFTDISGKTLMEALRECGINPLRIADARLPEGYAKAHVELHIEQGGVLESKNLAVGVVTGICCLTRMEVVIDGISSHAGTTPMNLRKDALAAAAECMVAIEAEAKKYPYSVATVGRIQAFPGGVNIVPGQAMFTIDLRSQTKETRDTVHEACVMQMEEICRKRGVGVQIRLLMDGGEGKACAEPIQNMIAESCEEIGLPVYRLPSGAGHDSNAFAHFCPMGMIFVRSKDGLSHNKDEYSSPDDCAAGTEVLYSTLLKLAVENTVKN